MLNFKQLPFQMHFSLTFFECFLGAKHLRSDGLTCMTTFNCIHFSRQQDDAGSIFCLFLDAGIMNAHLTDEETEAQ